MKILVVDDIGYARHFHTRLLQKFGHAAVAAGSGAEALKMLKTDHSIDVVLTDLSMADMDGIELCQQAHRMERMNDAGPVEPPQFVLMTALHPGKNAQQRDLDRLRIAKEVGFAEVLFKPLEQEGLIASLERLKGNKKAVRLDVGPMIQQVAQTVRTLLESGTPEDFQKFLDAVEPDILALRDAALA